MRGKIEYLFCCAFFFSSIVCPALNASIYLLLATVRPSLRLVFFFMSVFLTRIKKICSPSFHETTTKNPCISLVRIHDTLLFVCNQPSSSSPLFCPSCSLVSSLFLYDRLSLLVFVCCCLECSYAYSHVLLCDIPHVR